MNWHDLLFLHWSCSADAVAELLPKQVTLDLFQDRAWVSVVPFRMSGVAPRWFPNLPWLSAFPELNVRTYVTVNGKPGVWFFTLDATNPIAVRVARCWFHLNYVDAKIDLTFRDNWIQYRSRRIDRMQPSAELSVDYRPIGDSYVASKGTLEHWLTSRYCLYSADADGGIYRGEIDHAEWRLRKAQVLIHRNTMCDALGLDCGGSPDFLQFAKKTKVKAWKIQKVA